MAQIYILVGPPAVGKSTTAHALATHFEKSIHIPVDDIREMVVSGLTHPGKDWSHELVEQLELARSSVHTMANTYNEAGFVVVIDDFWDPNSRLQEYGNLFQQPNVQKLLILPDQITAEKRNINRAGQGDASKYIADGIRDVYENLETDLDYLKQQGWIVVDTTDITVEETIQFILAINN